VSRSKRGSWACTWSADSERSEQAHVVGDTLKALPPSIRPKRHHRLKASRRRADRPPEAAHHPRAIQIASIDWWGLAPWPPSPSTSHSSRQLRPLRLPLRTRCCPPPAWKHMQAEQAAPPIAPSASTSGSLRIPRAENKQPHPGLELSGKGASSRGTPSPSAGVVRAWPAGVASGPCGRRQRPDPGALSTAGHHKSTRKATSGAPTGQLKRATIAGPAHHRHAPPAELPQLPGHQGRRLISARLRLRVGMEMAAQTNQVPGRACSRACSRPKRSKSPPAAGRARRGAWRGRRSGKAAGTWQREFIGLARFRNLQGRSRVRRPARIAG